ncbi:MAG: two-component system response regulator [Magnetococcus sp. MYC-9]
MDTSTVLIIDDTPDNLVLLSSLFKGIYKVKAANNGRDGVRIASTGVAPDLILLDVMMPEMDGYEVCRHLKAQPATEGIPIIFLTAKSATEDEQKGLELGAVDYITKPIHPSVVLARVRGQLALKAHADLLRNQNQRLEQEVARRTAEIMAIQDVTILALASLAEIRDFETGQHIRRTQYYVKILSERLQTHPRFSPFCSEQNRVLLFKSAPLHDIGKVGIPDHILLKPGRLDPHELAVMQTHTTLGRDALVKAEQWLGASVEFLGMAKQIACSHHEKWDGSGYPHGLSGELIPVAARFMAVADVYDALISRRVYKPGQSHDEAVRILCEGRGNHFDPDIVDAFLDVQQEIQSIARRHADTERV